MKLKYHGRNKYPGVGMYRAAAGRRWVATGFRVPGETLWNACKEIKR